MRRTLFLVLLLILPVQFAWAAASGYCRHETGDAKKHFGHHEHQHRAAEDGESKDTTTTSADNDCGMCQLSAAQPIPSTQEDIAIIRTEAPHSAYRARYDSHIPSGPERPDRAAPTPAVRIGGAVVIGALLLA